MSRTNFTDTRNPAAAERCECPSSTKATTRSRSSTGCGLPIPDPHTCLADREPRIRRHGNPESGSPQHALTAGSRPAGSSHPFASNRVNHVSKGACYFPWRRAVGRRVPQAALGGTTAGVRTNCVGWRIITADWPCRLVDEPDRPKPTVVGPGAARVTRLPETVRREERPLRVGQRLPKQGCLPFGNLERLNSPLGNPQTSTALAGR